MALELTHAASTFIKLLCPPRIFWEITKRAALFSFVGAVIFLLLGAIQGAGFGAVGVALLAWSDIFAASKMSFAEILFFGAFSGGVYGAAIGAASSAIAFAIGGVLQKPMVDLGEAFRDAVRGAWQAAFLFGVIGAASGMIVVWWTLNSEVLTQRFGFLSLDDTVMIGYFYGSIAGFVIGMFIGTISGALRTWPRHPLRAVYAFFVQSLKMKA